MKAKELIDFLSTINPNAEIVIYRDTESPGYGLCKDLKCGVFVLTEYGNDFYPGEKMIVNAAEVDAVCLVPEDDYVEDQSEDSK
jgi:hypothetical protein